MLILVVALLLFGPRKIPEIGRTLGKTMAEFRKATRDFKLNLEREVDMEDLRNAGDELRSARNDMNTIARDAMTLSPVSSEPPEAAAPAPVKESVAVNKDSKDEAQKNDDGSGENS